MMTARAEEAGTSPPGHEKEIQFFFQSDGSHRINEYRGETYQLIWHKDTGEVGAHGTRGSRVCGGDGACSSGRLGEGVWQNVWPGRLEFKEDLDGTQKRGNCWHVHDHQNLDRGWNPTEENVDLETKKRVMPRPWSVLRFEERGRELHAERPEGKQ